MTISICRDGKEFVLTEEEIYTIYQSAKRKYYQEDVCEHIALHYNVDPHQIGVDLDQLTNDILDDIAETDTIWECEQESFDTIIEKYLKEKGIEK